MTESTVWTREEPRRRPPLTREAIVAAAIEIGDAEGVTAISIRRIAARLGARAMSLYSHIERKEDLFELIADELVNEILIPDGEMPADWRAAITEITRRERRAVLRHPWVIDLVGQRATAGPNKLRHMEQSLAALEGLGVDDMTALRVIGAVSNYMLGCVIAEVNESKMGRAAPDGDPLAHLRALASGCRFHRLEPLLDKIGGPEWPGREERFEQGLAWLLDGIEESLARRGLTAPDRPRTAPPRG